MSSSRRSIFAVVVLAGIVACARIAGLDESGGSAQTRSDAGTTTTADGAELMPAALNVSALCDKAAAASEDFRIKNTSATTLAYTLESGDPKSISFQIAGGESVTTLSGTIEPGKASDAIAVSAVSGTAGTSTKTFTVTTGTTQTVVPVTVAVQGSLIDLVPTTIDFGAAHNNATTAPQDVIITNKGTENVLIDGWDTGGNTAVSMGANAIVVAPDQAVKTTVAYQAGGENSSIDATVKPITRSALCGALPTLHVTGNSVSTAVTVNPASLGFGKVGCGDSPAAKTLSVSNFSSSDASYTLTFQSNSWFKSDVLTGTVPKGGAPVSIPITLIPQQTFGDRSEKVVVMVTGADVAPPINLDVPLTVSMRGASLSFSPTSATLASGGSKSVHITNSGNEGCGLVVNTNSGSFSVGQSFNPLGAPGNPFGSGFDFTVKATAGGSATDITFTATYNLVAGGDGPICGQPTFHVVSQ